MTTLDLLSNCISLKKDEIAYCHRGYKYTITYNAKWVDYVIKLLGMYSSNIYDCGDNLICCKTHLEGRNYDNT